MLHVDQSPAVQTSKNLGEIENHIRFETYPQLQFSTLDIIYYQVIFFVLIRIDIAKIFCNSIFKYVRDVNNADILSKTLGLLAEMIKW